MRTGDGRPPGCAPTRSPHVGVRRGLRRRPWNVAPGTAWPPPTTNRGQDAREDAARYDRLRGGVQVRSMGSPIARWRIHQRVAGRHHHAPRRNPEHDEDGQGGEADDGLGAGRSGRMAAPGGGGRARGSGRDGHRVLRRVMEPPAGHGAGSAAGAGGSWTVGSMASARPAGTRRAAAGTVTTTSSTGRSRRAHGRHAAPAGTRGGHGPPSRRSRVAQDDHLGSAVTTAPRDREDGGAPCRDGVAPAS